MAKSKSEDLSKPKDANEPIRAKMAKIDVPAPGGYVLAENGANPTIKVISPEWDPVNIDMVWAKVHATTDPIEIPSNPDVDPKGYMQLTSADGIEWTGNVSIPASTVCAVTNPQGNNLAVTVVGAWQGSTTGKPAYTTFFKYVCRRYWEYVPAHACPWFAFRSNGVGPKGEDIESHRPIRVPFPENAASIKITASGWWRKEPITAAGDGGGGTPSGIPGTIDYAIDPTYQNLSGENGFPMIGSPDEGQLLRVTLVGVLEKKAPTAANTKILAIGSSKVLDAAQVDSEAIHLGLWDGSQWNRGENEFTPSNSGKVLVVFEWAPA